MLELAEQTIQKYLEARFVGSVRILGISVLGQEPRAGDLKGYVRCGIRSCRRACARRCSTSCERCSIPPASIRRASTGTAAGELTRRAFAGGTYEYRTTGDAAP